MSLPNNRKYFYKYVRDIILFFLVIFLIFYLRDPEKIEIVINSTVLSFLITSIFFLVPMLILFFNYLSYNKYSKLEIREAVFYYENKKNNVRFHLTDIKEVVIYVNHSKFDSFPGIFFWTQYFYSKFVLKDGRIIYITCLLNDEIDLVVPKKKISFIKKFMPLIISEEKERLQEIKKNNTKSKLDKKQHDKNDQLRSKFKEKFKTKSIEELHVIIANPEKYQSQAVEVAKEIIKNI